MSQNTIALFRVLADVLDSADCSRLARALEVVDASIELHTKKKAFFGTHGSGDIEATVAEEIADANIALYQDIRRRIQEKRSALGC